MTGKVHSSSLLSRASSETPSPFPTAKEVIPQKQPTEKESADLGTQRVLSFSQYMARTSALS